MKAFLIGFVNVLWWSIRHPGKGFVLDKTTGKVESERTEDC